MIQKKMAFVMPFHILQRFGGAEVQAWFLAKELAHRGYEIHYICQSVKPEKAHRKEIMDDVMIHWLPMWGYLSGRFRWLDAGKYFRALTETNPDVVIQRLSSCVTEVIGKFCRRYKKKFIWICTDDISPLRWMHLSKQRQIHQDRKVTWPKRAVFLANAFICDIKRQRGMRHITQAFTLNDIQKENLWRSLHIMSERIISGHPKPTTVSPPEEKMKKPLVLWVSNLSYNKRPELFVDLARNCYETNLKFVMIGKPRDSTYMRRLFRSKPSNLQWTGWLQFDEAVSWFDRATFFVNTSMQEGFPNTFIQAWLRGVPTFSIGVDPNGVISENRLGYVATDLCDLERKLIRLINSQEEYIELSRNAKTYAERHHTVEVMTDHFLHVLQQEYVLVETMQS